MIVEKVAEALDLDLDLDKLDTVDVRGFGLYAVGGAGAVI